MQLPRREDCMLNNSICSLNNIFFSSCLNSQQSLITLHSLLIRFNCRNMRLVTKFLHYWNVNLPIPPKFTDNNETIHLFRTFCQSHALQHNQVNRPCLFHQLFSLTDFYVNPSIFESCRSPTNRWIGFTCSYSPINKYLRFKKSFCSLLSETSLTHSGVFGTVFFKYKSEIAMKM